MNRFLSYVLVPAVALAMLIPVGCNQVPAQSPTSATNNNVGSQTGNNLPPQGPSNNKQVPVGNGPASKVVSAVSYSNGSNDSKVSYTRTEYFYPDNSSWSYSYAYYPFGIGILPNGNLVTADYYNSQVDVVSPTGAPNNGNPVPGTNFGNGQLSYPYGLAVDSQGNVYVANYDDSNVVKYNASGVYQATITHGFSRVYGVTVDNAGNIYVLDGGYENVQKFNSNFQFQKSWVILIVPGA